jgi:serine/arginine repetitive matrix protein 2
MGPALKSNQWVRPGLNLGNRPMVPTKREYPADDRDRPFGSAPKAPKFETSISVTDSQRPEHTKPASPAMSRSRPDCEPGRDKELPVDSRKDDSPKAESAHTRRFSDITMAEPSPRLDKPPISATSSAPEAMVDSDDDLDLDDADFAESEAKYNREKALLESKRIDLSAPNLRANTPLQEIMLLASLTIEHLPCQESKSIEQEIIPMSPVQPEPESITAELPTPKADEVEDMDMDEKDDADEKQPAPATRALRLRRGTGEDYEENPDLSSLPYLGSAPLTPISELEGPRVSESIMSAIRDKLRRTTEPESNPKDTLEQFASVYRTWRDYVRILDDSRDGVEQERQPSAEPLKPTTPDVQSSAMGPLLDLPPPTTSRRGHSHRWATEYDLDLVIKESLKTAEEESKGKRESEPRRSMADPEKEAEVPPELTAYEAQRRRFIDTNFQREPGQGIFAFHYEPPEDDFTEVEHRIMVQNYRDQWAKRWGKLAEALYKEAGTSRTYKDCINHYYATKWGKEYKGKVKRGRGGPRRRGGGAGRGRGAIANMERPEVSGEDGLPPALTDTGRPRRSAAPTFGGPGPETDLDTTTSTPTPGRMRRGTDADGNSEKTGRRGKPAKEKGGRKAKVQAQAQPLVAAPVESPIKPDRKALSVKTEDEAGKPPLGEMPFPMHFSIPEDQLAMAGDPQFHPGLGIGFLERSRLPPSARPGPSSYWSVTEQTDFQRNVAYFGTDWAAIATHMGTKTQTMVKNQYLRLVDSGQAPELERVAVEADQKRQRGEDPGPPPTPTPAPKRRYESNQVTLPRTLAPTPEASLPPSVPLPKASPPNVPPSSRFSNIAQAPQQSKPIVSAAGYAMPDSALASIPSVSQQQSPQGHPPRGQSQHHIQHSLSRPEVHHRGEPPRSGYFSQTDFPARRETRAPSQSSVVPQNSRPLQPQVQPQMRAHEQPDLSLFRPNGLQERETLSRTEHSQEHDAHLRFQTHSRHVSGDLQGRHFSSAAGGQPHMRPPPGAGSPEHRSHPLQHRHMQQPQSTVPTPPDVAVQSSALSAAQQLPPRSTVATPPVKDEARHYAHPLQQPQQPQQLQTQSQAFPPASQPPIQVASSAPTPPASKPTAEPRKSNLLSLLNDTEPEEPRRRKPVEQNVPSHTPTPQQQTPIAPPPPLSQGLPPRRDPYDAASSQAPYGRPSYAQQTALPQMSNRQVVDLTSEQVSAGRGPGRESWPRQPYPGPNQAQQSSGHSSPHPGLAQPAFGDSRLNFGGHRAVFAQHNGPRHNPSPPPLSAFSNSPHLHSRTPSISGAASQQPRHTMSSSTAGQHSQLQAGSSQILQPNPYAQVDPPGSGSQPSGPVGMRPSPHLHTSHVGPQREAHARNEQAQVQNGGLAYSNPQAPSEHHPTSQHMRGASISDQYRGRDPRDGRHDFDARNGERDMSREVSHQANALLREQRDAMLSRSTGPPQSHQDVRYQPPPQDRGFATQRSHTPLSRSDHGPAPPLQHPPHSSLGDNHPLYNGPRQDEHTRHFRDPFPRESRMEHMRDEQHHQQQQQRQQQQLNAAMSREEFMGREREMRDREMRDREMRDREMRERDAQYRESLMRRGQPPQPPQGQQVEQRGSGVPPDWANAVRPQERQPWQR